MRGSYLTLFIVYIAGAMCLISMGLIIAARLRTEELADGLLNIFSWPMLLLSGVWFSMEGANPIMRQAAQLLPLTHVLEAARAIMLDGAGLADVSRSLLILTYALCGFANLSSIAILLGGLGVLVPEKRDLIGQI